jgi:hypothetical protein
MPAECRRVRAMGEEFVKTTGRRKARLFPTCFPYMARRAYDYFPGACLLYT